MKSNESLRDGLNRLNREIAADSRREFLTNKEAADYLRCSSATLWRYRRAGKLPFSRIGSQVRFRREDLNNLLEVGR